MSQALRIYLHTGWLSLAILLTACRLVDGYHSQAHMQLTGLMSAHLQMIDDYAGTSDTQANATLKEEDRYLRLRFAEAIAYAESLGDPLRTDNLRLLQSLYREDYAALLRHRSSFTPAQATLWREQTRLAYLEAIRGECHRPGSPCQ